MSANPEINNVSDTSFWVAYYRARENQRPDALFRDPFAQRLVGDRGERIAAAMPKISKYTEWSVISRTVMIDRFIEALIKEGVDAVVNLGAGLDTRPYRMQLPVDFQWVEVDYENIILHKNKILKNEKPTCQLTRVVVDLADDGKRRNFLFSVVPHAKKVLILTEGVIPYLSPEQVAHLGKDLLVQKRFSFWITEYFHPRVYKYLQSTVRAAKMKNAPFRFYPPDWFGFFKDIGWIEKETRFSAEIAIEFKRKMPMPLIGRMMYFLMPKKIKEQMSRMSGYTVLQRKNHE